MVVSSDFGTDLFRNMRRRVEVVVDDQGRVVAAVAAALYGHDVVAVENSQVQTSEFEFDLLAPASSVLPRRRP